MIHYSSTMTSMQYLHYFSFIFNNLPCKNNIKHLLNKLLIRIYSIFTFSFRYAHFLGEVIKLIHFLSFWTWFLN